MHSSHTLSSVITEVGLKNIKYPSELTFFPAERGNGHLQTLGLLQWSAPDLTLPSLGWPDWAQAAGPVPNISEQQERFGCWPSAAEVSWQREAGIGKITAELQPMALRQGKPICFQVYFILHCTLLIKWTFNPFGKPHGAQIHPANLSFPPGVYLD